MYKKLMAVVMVLALALTMFNYMPAKTSAAQSDAAGYDYSSTNYVGSEDGAYVNKIKMAPINDSNLQEVVNIQSPGFATGLGVYVTFKSADFGTVKINGNNASYDQQGAGLIIHVSNFTAKYSDLVITKSNGTVAAEFYVYYADGDDGEGGGSGDPGDTTTAQTEPTTQASAEGQELLPALNEWNTYPADATKTASSVTANIPAYTGGDNWASQLVKNGLVLTAGKWYRASVTLTSSVARKFQLLLQSDGQQGGDWGVLNSNNVFEVNANESYTFTVVVQASTVKNNYLFGIMMGYVDDTVTTACTVEVTAASLKQYSSEEAANAGEEPTQGGDEPAELTAPSKVDAFNFYATGAGYQVVFKPGAKDDLTFKPGDEGAVSYNIYVDDSGVLASFNAEDCTLVDKKKGSYSPANLEASVFSSYADDKVHSIYIQAVDAEGNTSAKSKAGKVRITTSATSAKPSTDPTDISRVYIVTNNATDLDTFNDKTKEQSKQDAALTIISGDGTIKSASHYGTVKLRGNSTAVADKKAYNISFNDKKEVIDGAPKGKKWCLLANAYEKTLIRNKLAMDFGLKLGNVATPMESYTDVYVNGVYKGTFTISEPADNERAGVNYNEDGNDLLFELEANDRDESSVGAAYYTPSLGKRFVTEDLEDEVLALYEGGATNQNAVAAALSSNPKFAAFKSTLDSFESALVKTNTTEYTNYIDVDSFVDMYIINELFQTVDFGYSSVKFYITYDENDNPTIHAGPLWDFDLASGNSGNAASRTYNTLRRQKVNPWFRELMKHSDFAAKVKAKYQQMQGYIQNIYQDNVLGTNEIDKNVARIEASRLRNYSSTANGGAGWSETTPDTADVVVYNYSYCTASPYNTYTYSQHIEYLRDWLQARNEYLVNTWGLSLDFDYDDGEITVTDDLAITGYQISTNYGSESGQIGQRTVYQAEPTVEGKKPVEVGLVYGINAGTPLTSDDLIVGSENNYVLSYAATAQGTLDKKMGSSSTANYYAMTMVNNTNVTTAMYTTEYYVRVYAKFSDNTYAYSTVKSYTVFRIADYLYQNNLISTFSAYNYIYDKVLHYCDSTYQPGDYDWSNTIVKVG